MNSGNHDDLLWRLADHGPEDEAPEPCDSELEAYRRGELDAPEQRRMEALLARDPGARRRLVELAGVTPAAPSADLRARILARAPARWRPRRLVLVGAGLAASLLLAVAVLHMLPGDLPEELHYDVLASGLAETRGGSDQTERLSAYPETEVRIDVVPRGPARPGVEFGLYRVRDGRVERVEPGAGVRLLQDRGTARWVARASDLVGAAPGDSVVLVVVAAEGDLPVTLRLEAGQDPVAALAAGQRRRVYRQPITVHPPADQAAD